MALDSNRDKLTLGQLITHLRKEKGYSQRKFAQISGLSNTTISRIEYGETHNPDIDTLKLLAAHLDHPASELIKLIDMKQVQEGSMKSAKLKFLSQPVKRIKRYSSVSTSAYEDEVKEESINIIEQQHEQVPVSELITEAKTEIEPVKKAVLKGMRLITLRLEKNITQKELADALGIDKILISQYEGEIVKPDYETVQRIADFFGVTADYLADKQVIEVSKYPETKDLFRNTTRDNVLKNQGLRPEYLEIAKEIQDAGIEIQDVKAIIDMLKKYKG